MQCHSKNPLSDVCWSFLRCAFEFFSPVFRPHPCSFHFNAFNQPVSQRLRCLRGNWKAICYLEFPCRFNDCFLYGEFFVLNPNEHGPATRKSWLCCFKHLSIDFRKMRRQCTTANRPYIIECWAPTTSLQNDSNIFRFCILFPPFIFVSLLFLVRTSWLAGAGCAKQECWKLFTSKIRNGKKTHRKKWNFSTFSASSKTFRKWNIMFPEDTMSTR